MPPPACRALIAETRKAINDLQSALGGTELELLRAATFEQAIDLARERKPHVCIVGYHFDEARPYRLINRLRGELGEEVPILLIRALPLTTPDRDEEQIGDSYRNIGADEYLPLYDYAQSQGWSRAWDRLAQEVEKRLRQSNCQL